MNTILILLVIITLANSLEDIFILFSSHDINHLYTEVLRLKDVQCDVLKRLNEIRESQEGK